MPRRLGRVVDHEHVAGIGLLERLEEHVDASAVAGRPGPADDARALPQRTDVRGRLPDRNTEAHHRVGDMGRGEVRGTHLAGQGVP